MNGGTWTAANFTNEVDLVDEEEALLTGPSLDEHNKALIKNLETATRLLTLTQARESVLWENRNKIMKIAWRIQHTRIIGSVINYIQNCEQHDTG